MRKILSILFVMVTLVALGVSQAVKPFVRVGTGSYGAFYVNTRSIHRVGQTVAFDWWFRYRQSNFKMEATTNCLTNDYALERRTIFQPNKEKDVTDFNKISSNPYTVVTDGTVEYSLVDYVCNFRNPKP